MSLNRLKSVEFEFHVRKRSHDPSSFSLFLVWFNSTLGYQIEILPMPSRFSVKNFGKNRDWKFAKTRAKFGMFLLFHLQTDHN